MTTGNNLPGLIEVQLNGVSLGEFNLPGGNEPIAAVNWQVKANDILSTVKIVKGENKLSFVLKANPTSAKGLRIYSTKNSADSKIAKAIPLTLNVSSGTPLKQTIFTIPVWGEEGEHILSKLTVPGIKKFTQQLPEKKQQPFALNKKDVQKGYVVFSRNFQRYVYPWTIPAKNEQVESLNLVMAQNDFEPMTFSIYPIKDLGNVKVSISNLRGADNEIIPSKNVEVNVVKTIKKRTGSGGEYKLVPRLLSQKNHSNIPLSYTTRFWLTVYTSSTTVAGTYSGLIQIDADNEMPSTIPITVEVLPVQLEPVPKIDYSMCMSYEFFELESKDWTAQEKEKIYQDGVNVFRDYKNHGMTTVDVTTPYYFQWNKDGTPQMEHFKGMVKGAKEVGLTNPIYWYFGHYVQVTKGQHPGNVRTYNPKVHLKRTKFLVKTALKINKQLDGLPIYFMPIDEPRIASRKEITIDLFKEIKKIPGTTIMCTTDIGGKMLDIENNSQQDRKPLPPGVKKRESDRKVWEYNNNLSST
ncbi:MAG: hypothetical protein L3J29_08890 [Cyclobacteriaceae bacterium]|nr:hypothetical protein [Cyclobacteriaceae bacterium]